MSKTLKELRHEYAEIERHYQHVLENFNMMGIRSENISAAHVQMLRVRESRDMAKLNYGRAVKIAQENTDLK